MQGLLIVDKPIGWTSFDAVNYIRKMVANKEGKKPKNVKVGHAGTLDPFASGLLIILVGKEYTTRSDEFLKQDKCYELTMKLGTTTATGDIEGEILTSSDIVPSLDEVKQSLESFKGEIQQVPPIYSAIKVNGQRAYKLARSGLEVKLESRSVEIKSLKLTNYEYPEASLVTKVSSGTYIRSLVEDIGKTLNCGAYTTKLRRTEIGQYNIRNAVQVKSLDLTNIEQFLLNA